MEKCDLENRFIDFILHVRKVTGHLNRNDFSITVSNQLSRSAFSSLLNYGEARSAQSTKDFIHKLSIVLKELRETKLNLRAIEKMRICNNDNLVKAALKENDELLAIIYSSIQTAKKRLK